jgi:transketolase
MLLHGGLRTYVGTFLVFSDYMKNAIRVAALSKVPAIYLFSHDTVALGEDGPTHQPIEQLAMLRATPNINVWRPADARETATAWKQAILSKETPTALILSRQNLPTLVGSNYQNAKKGGYIISKEDKKLDFTLIATGSEVSLALKAKEELLKDKIDVRVVSLPSMEIFKTQDEDYINEVLGKDYNKRIAIELLSPFGWHEFAKHTFTINRFGLSAPMKDVLESLEYTPEALANKVREILGVKKEVKKELKEDPKKEAKEETKEEPKKETEEETKEVVKEETEKEIKEEIEKEVEVKE